MSQLSQSNVLLVSAPNQPELSSLAGELSSRGIQTAVATDATSAQMYAPQSALCIAVINNKTWNDPAVVAAVTAVGARRGGLVAVLLEQMNLPNGPWTFQPIPYTPQAADILAGYVRQMAFQPTQQPAASALQSNTAGAARKSPANTTRRNLVRIRLIISIIIAVIAIGYGVYKVLPAGNPNYYQSYATNTPAAQCDSSSNFSTVNGDHSTIQCKSNGALYTTTDTAEMYFNESNTNAQFPASYNLSIAAQFVTPQETVSVGFEVHHQDPHGGQIFMLYNNGLWEVTRLGTDNKTETLLASGFLNNLLTTNTISAHVQGDSMQFSINGQQVISLADTTYSSTHDILLMYFNNDPNSHSASVLLSNFSFKPESGAGVSASSAAATATAEVQPSYTQPYSAKVPGPGCDTGGAQWASPSYDTQVTTTYQCGASALEITQPDQTNIGVIRFLGQGYLLPVNYKVQVTEDLSKASNGCGIISARRNANGMYVYVICSDGSWSMQSVDSNGKFTTLASGNVAVAKTYTVTAEVNSSTISMYINSVKVAVATDSTDSATGTLGLEVLPPQSGGSTVGFSNFTFTPLP